MTEHYMRLGNGIIENMDMQSMAYGPDSEVYKQKVNDHFKVRHYEPKPFEKEIAEVNAEQRVKRQISKANLARQMHEICETGFTQ